MEAVYQSVYAGGREVRGRRAGAVSGIITRLLGCWHARMGRPVTREGETYRACLDCGARRRFDTRTWKTIGGFYYATPEEAVAAAVEAARGRSLPAGKTRLGPATA